MLAKWQNGYHFNIIQYYTHIIKLDSKSKMDNNNLNKQQTSNLRKMREN
jgi:hypothetical protein